MEALLIDARYAAGLNGAGAGCDMECSLIPWGGGHGDGPILHPLLSKWASFYEVGLYFYFFILIHIMLEEE